MVLFVAMLYVPLFLQTVQGKSPFTAGLYVIPMLVGLVAATAVAGPVIARTGRYKIFPVIGSVLTGGSPGHAGEAAVAADGRYRRGQGRSPGVLTGVSDDGYSGIRGGR
jgi:hypothetical protein